MLRRSWILAGASVALALIALSHRPAFASADRIAPELARLIDRAPDQSVVVWVYFTDRAGRDHDPAALDAARRGWTQRAVARRLRRGTLPGPVASDLPVHEPYVRALAVRGAQVRGASRWLNAASVTIPARLALDLARLPFVARIESVPLAYHDQPAPSRPRFDESAIVGEIESARPAPTILAPGDTSYYGGSFKQLSMMQVPQLHAMGLTGAGVLVAILDNGFHTTHQAFSTLNVIATRDFIFGDTNVAYDPAQDSVGQDSHGTWTLSCVAGSKPGTYSGPAFGASVALAKTEWNPSETPSEMDNWQFAAEWADSLGADVISSSLGYLDFDSPYPSYSYADLNGQTTVVTRAAAEAARRGITVVTACGNGGPGVGSLIAPGDADSIVTSGAVDSLNNVSSFSSRGPTSDGRIKPDVTAMGSAVFMVSVSNNATYERHSGTSFSTPLTAGLVALLLESHPLWRPFEVREALRETAKNHTAPNNNIGWGLVEGLLANAWIPSTTSAGEPDAPGDAIQLAAAPNPVRPGAGTTIRFAAPSNATVTLDVLDVSGRRVNRLFDGAVTGPRTVVWDGRDARGASLAAGVYWVRLSANGGAMVSARRSTRVVLVP